MRLKSYCLLMREKLKYTSDASTPAEADEALRRQAAERLVDHLEIATSLVGHCEMMAGKPTGDRLKPVFAAAQLMRANAVIAEALANFVRIERRRRSIIERIQPLDPKKAELNSHLRQKKNICRRGGETLQTAGRGRRTIDPGAPGRRERGGPRGEPPEKSRGKSREIAQGRSR